MMRRAYARLAQDVVRAATEREAPVRVQLVGVDAQRSLTDGAARTHQKYADRVRRAADVYGRVGRHPERLREQVDHREVVAVPLFCVVRRQHRVWSDLAQQSHELAHGLLATPLSEGLRS